MEIHSHSRTFIPIPILMIIIVIVTLIPMHISSIVTDRVSNITFHYYLAPPRR